MPLLCSERIGKAVAITPLHYAFNIDMYRTPCRQFPGTSVSRAKIFKAETLVLAHRDLFLKTRPCDFVYYSNLPTNQYII